MVNYEFWKSLSAVRILTTTATPFYASGWFIAIFAVAGALIVIGLLSGIAYYVYTKWKASNATAESMQENTAMEMRAPSGSKYNQK